LLAQELHSVYRKISTTGWAVMEAITRAMMRSPLLES
jgi:hypothetical protein